MSQDIFRDIESASESDPDDDLIQREFSGVSAGCDSNATSKSPLSQPQQSAGPSVTANPPPEPEPQAASSSKATPSSFPIPEIFVCPVCRSKLKTVKGFTGHLLRHNRPGLDFDSYMRGLAAAAASPQQPATSAGPKPTSSKRGRVSNEAQQTPATPEVPQPAEVVYQCNDCGATYASKSGFSKHRANHKLSEIEKRKPQPDDFKGNLLNSLTKIITEISEEPTYESISEDKTVFLTQLKADIESGSCSEFLQFATVLSDKVCELMWQKGKKLLPISQYQELQTQLFAWLCDERKMAVLLDKFLAYSQVLSEPKAKRLIFRIAQKYMQAAQSYVAKGMVINPVGEAVEMELETVEMSAREKRAFARTLGEIFRAVYKKCLISGSKQWEKRSACLSDSFVIGQHPISSSTFLDKNVWFSGSEDCIEPSDRAVDFFLVVHDILKICNTVQEIVDKVFENNSALDNWYFLTTAHFSDESSILFLRDLVTIFCKRSRNLEESKRNRAEDKRIQATKQTLRHSLQRNYPEKDSEAVENIA